MFRVLGVGAFGVLTFWFSEGGVWIFGGAERGRGA